MKRIAGFFLVLLVACSSEKKAEVNLSDTIVTQNIKDAIKPTFSKGALSSQLSILLMREALDNVNLLIPRSFETMDAEMVVMKYPSKQHTEFQVYTDEDATVNIALEHTSNKATLQDLPSIKKVFEEQFDQPQIDFRNSELKQINGRDFIVIEMITPAVDTKVYNLMFVTSLEGRLLIGTFNCTIDKMLQWRGTAYQILNSVKVKN